jgi:hypothetical protein
MQGRKRAADSAGPDLAVFQRAANPGAERQARYRQAATHLQAHRILLAQALERLCHRLSVALVRHTQLLLVGRHTGVPGFGGAQCAAGPFERRSWTRRSLGRPLAANFFTKRTPPPRLLLNPHATVLTGASFPPNGPANFPAHVVTSTSRGSGNFSYAVSSVLLIAVWARRSYALRSARPAHSTQP